MDIPAPPNPIPLSEDDESFLDNAYVRIIDLIDDGKRPDPSAIADGRPHLLARLKHLVQVARAVSPLHERKSPLLPGYQVLSRLGAGGMGEVFLCRQEKMGGRLVAVKVLSEAFASSRRRLDMLRDEAMALARLRHPGVVDVYEFIVGLDDDDNTIQAFAMQWIQGCSLAQWFARLGATRPCDSRLPTIASNSPQASDQAPAPDAWMPSLSVENPLGFACRVLASVAHTVHAVHREGLLHRDLKPSNILLREDGSPLVSDFGLARDMRQDAPDEPAAGFSGTRAFASPEQCRGEPLDARSDIYSLGMTLRHVLPGPPSGDLGAIVAKATAPAPEQRYASAADFAADIERFLSHRPVRASPPRPHRRCAMFLRRNRRATIGTAVGAVFAFVLAGAIVTAVFIAPRRAETHLTRARLELLSPGHANVIWNTEWYGNRSARFELGTDDRARAADAYRAALRWRFWGAWGSAVRRELEVIEGRNADEGDLRLSGLAAYLAGNSTGAIRNWSQLAAREDPDAFIDGALGVLYLIREQYALAYPRLEHARSAFPRVGFLAAYHADAAVGCGDLDRAERLLDEAAHFGNQDNHRALTRVRSDLYLARGRLDEAHEAILHATLDRKSIADLRRLASSPRDEGELLTRAALTSPIAATRIARIRAARGDYAGAAGALGTALASGLGPPSARAEFTTYIDRWWESLSPSARRHAIRRSMDLDANDPASLAFRLRHADSDDSIESGPTARRAIPGASEGAGSVWRAILNDFMALGGPDSHTSLERASRGEMARRLEVGNMDRWNGLSGYSTAMKLWQWAAWQSPMPRTAGELLARLHRALGRWGQPAAPAEEASKDAAAPG